MEAAEKLKLKYIFVARLTQTVRSLSRKVPAMNGLLIGFK